MACARARIRVYLSQYKKTGYLRETEKKGFSKPFLYDTFFSKGHIMNIAYLSKDEQRAYNRAIQEATTTMVCVYRIRKVKDKATSAALDVLRGACAVAEGSLRHALLERKKKLWKVAYPELARHLS